MRIAVWDTYVKRKDGRIMHFDILVPDTLTDTDIIFGFGKQYLEYKQEEGQELSAEECQFCHIEVAPVAIKEQVDAHGYSIIEMENCD